eukprot:5888785-Prymnesium_polylepis.1
MHGPPSPSTNHHALVGADGCEYVRYVGNGYLEHVYTRVDSGSCGPRDLRHAPVLHTSGGAPRADGVVAGLAARQAAPGGRELPAGRRQVVGRHAARVVARGADGHAIGGGRKALPHAGCQWRRTARSDRRFQRRRPEEPQGPGHHRRCWRAVSRTATAAGDAARVHQAAAPRHLLDGPVPVSLQHRRRQL